MIADLKPYAEYKESGLPQLGRVPVHWSHLRAKYLFREVDERSATGREELLSVSHLTGVTPRSQKTITMFLAKSNVGHKICRPGDAVINTMWAWMGALGVTQYAGLVSPAYGVYRPLAGCNILPRYADHLLRTPAYAAEYQRRSTGVNSSRLRLYPEQFLRIAIAVPPAAEQAAIVRFLGWANGRLERAIRAKRKVIALLNEQKQAIIHRAVTRGLDPSVPVKPSGVPWLGDIPQHWDVATIGATATLIQTGPFGSQLHSHEYVSSGIPVINPSHMVGGQVKASQAVTIRREKANELSRHVLRSGDIVIARRGELGRCALVTGGEEGWICGTGSLLLRCKACCHPAFFRIVFSSRGIADMLSLSSIGATMANLNAGMVARQRLPLPPLDEQERIVHFIEDEADKVKIAVSRLEREIEFLREYRTRLVADVVTGKLDVCEAAAKLPDEAASATLEDEIDTEAVEEEAKV
jgi:type I restriction enzyme S subunit